jgi:hypothetical protein
VAPLRLARQSVTAFTLLNGPVHNVRSRHRRFTQSELSRLNASLIECRHNNERGRGFDSRVVPVANVYCVISGRALRLYMWYGRLRAWFQLTRRHALHGEKKRLYSLERDYKERITSSLWLHCTIASGNFHYTLKPGITWTRGERRRVRRRRSKER